MAARADCRCRRRLVGFGGGAVQCLADSLFHDPRAGVAGRWFPIRTLERRLYRRPCRLVLRLRLFRLRALLGRLRLSGRCQNLRLAVAGGGRRTACLPRDLYRAWTGGRASHLGARAASHSGLGRDHDDCRVAARPSAIGISLEHVRLCADAASGAGAKRFAHRHLGADLRRARGFCEPRRARRRPRRHAASLPRADLPRLWCWSRCLLTARCG